MKVIFDEPNDVMLIPQTEEEAALTKRLNDIRGETIRMVSADEREWEASALYLNTLNDSVSASDSASRLKV